MSSPPARDHTVGGAVAGAFRHAPPAARWYFACSAVYIAGMLAWLAVSSEGGLLRAPFYVAFLGGVSGIVLGATVMLFNVAQGDHWRQNRRIKLKWGLAPKRMTEMLLALPILAFSAGVMAAAATVVLIPYARKEPLVLGAVVATVYVTAASLKMTSDATRWLYGHAR
ncbi:MAG TPA: hypothetical protein VFJ16_15395, partial [Longimicrobium sp.]|nr:hypothetical protein [Longimicrobium sp.]